ncbi:unnamed protein product [Paramecium pentaurelia]|uniref:Insertion element IS150 protein InsJ-like helix-turn-helix domain-containing protein n=1 Tax=Paramecium pentaurelia TaxID=43138 RepID=A0A8S1WZP2_9CILI|nr:unnamed protein product [Paramecium pentaurelia]
MNYQFDGSQTKKKYAIITPAVRMAFIERVQSKKSTIKQAAQEFGIKFSTSKAILQTYKREGRVGKKKTRSRQKTFKLDSKNENKDEKFQDQRSIDFIDQKSQQNPQPIHLKQMTLQQEQAQQFQIFQLSLQMNPYLFLHQNLYLQQNHLQIPNPQPMNYYWQLNNLRIQTLPQSSEKILDSRQWLTPIQSTKLLDSKFNEIGPTLKDFN